MRLSFLRTPSLRRLLRSARGGVRMLLLQVARRRRWQLAVTLLVGLVLGLTAAGLFGLHGGHGLDADAGRHALDHAVQQLQDHR